MSGSSDERRSNSAVDVADHTPPLVDAGDPVIEAYKKDVDRTLLRENLRLTVEQRFVKFERFWEFAQELRAAGRKSRQAGSGHGAELPRDSADPRSG
jgi:hypothetical protein